MGDGRVGSLDDIIDDTRHFYCKNDELSFDDDQYLKKKSDSAPCNPVGMYLRNASKAKLLTRDEERAWFQIIEASSERVFSLFSQYPFAVQMYIRELEHLAHGRQHFDSVVSEGAGMSCAAYKKAIPELMKTLGGALDVLVGTCALRNAMTRSEADACGVSDMLKSAREKVAKCLRSLCFRRSVVEDLCDIAYEDIYLPCKEYGMRKDGSEESVVSMLGMPVQEFLSSFAEVRSTLGIIHAARSHIAQSNLRLVVHVAKKYVNRGIDMADLLQDGSIGLMNAIRKFDLSRGHKFSTFATWWIRQAISRALANNARTIRIPSHKIDQLNKLDKSERDLSQALHRPPTVEEVSKDMKLTCNDVVQLREIRRQTVSLDSAIGDDDDASLSDMMSDDKIPSPVDETERSLMCGKVRDALSVLTDRERMVVTLRFGLSDGSAKTLEEIGRVFNVTREHIRQVELEALSKLKKSRMLDALSELVK